MLHRLATQQRRKALTQLVGGQEMPIAAEVVGEYCALGAGNVPGNRVQRFHFTPKARQSAGIEQGQRRGIQALLQLLGAQQQGRVGLAAERAALC